VYNGIIKAADAESVTLLVPNKLVVVRRKQIEEMHESKVSIMPADLLKDFAEHEVRSLIAYLSGLEQVPMLATPENAPHFFFFGQDLSTWRSDGPAWRSDGGVIVAPEARVGRPAHLISDMHLPGDFHLTLRVGPGKEGRGAVLVQDVSRPGQAAPRVRLAAGEPVELDGVEGARVTRAGAAKARAEAWNKLEIIAAGDRLQVRLNDEEVATAAGLAASPRRVIVLQGPAEGGPGLRFRYLDMRLPAR
jgi:hypothetical protein